MMEELSSHQNETPPMSDVGFDADPSMEKFLTHLDPSDEPSGGRQMSSLAAAVETAALTATTTAMATAAMTTAAMTTATPLTRAMPVSPESTEMPLQHHQHHPTDSDMLACLLAMLQQRSAIDHPTIAADNDMYAEGSPSNEMHTLPSESTGDSAISLSGFASCGETAVPSCHRIETHDPINAGERVMLNGDPQPLHRNGDPTTNALLSSILGADVVWGPGNPLPDLVNLLAAVASGGALKPRHIPTLARPSEFAADCPQRLAQQMGNDTSGSGPTDGGMPGARMETSPRPLIGSSQQLVESPTDFLKEGLIMPTNQLSPPPAHHEGSDGLSLLASPTSPLELAPTAVRRSTAELGSIVSIAATGGNGAGSVSIASELFGSMMTLPSDAHKVVGTTTESGANDDLMDKTSDKGSHTASAQGDKPQGPLFHEDGSLNLEFFKVYPCKNESHVHDRKNCPFHHSQRDRRRYPVTYKAEQCEDNFDIEGDFVCSCLQADKCDKCHNRHELLYHPDIYKQRFCSSYNHLACHRGRFCAFAHTRQEIRCDLFLEEQERNPKPEFFMGKFKTLWCPFGIQHDWHGCLYAHTYQDCRRSPSIGYGSEPCPYWQKDLHSADYQKRCPFGPRCPYSHGSKEQLYHPAYYKTMPCADYKTKRSCPREQLCAFYHDISEKRTPVPGPLASPSPNGEKEETVEDSGAEVKVYDYTRPLPANLMNLLQPKFMWPPLFNLDDFEAFGHASRIGPPRKDSPVAAPHSPLLPMSRPPYSPWSHELLGYPSVHQTPQAYPRSAPGKRLLGNNLQSFGSHQGFGNGDHMPQMTHVPHLYQYPNSPYYDSPFSRQRQHITTPMTAPSRFGNTFGERRLPRPPTTHQRMQSFPRQSYR